MYSVSSQILNLIQINNFFLKRDFSDKLANRYDLWIIPFYGYTHKNIYEVKLHVYTSTVHMYIINVM